MIGIGSLRGRKFKIMHKNTYSGFLFPLSNTLYIFIILTINTLYYHCSDHSFGTLSQGCPSWASVSLQPWLWLPREELLHPGQALPVHCQGSQAGVQPLHCVARRGGLHTVPGQVLQGQAAVLQGQGRQQGAVQQQGDQPPHGLEQTEVVTRVQVRGR